MARSVDDLDKQIAQLKARKQALLRAESQKNRKARNHALMVMGGLVESCFDGGWQSVDFDKLAACLKNSRSALASCAGETVSTDDARKRLRDWEQKTKNRPSQ